MCVWAKHTPAKELGAARGRCASDGGLNGSCPFTERVFGRHVVCPCPANGGADQHAHQFEALVVETGGDKDAVQGLGNAVSERAFADGIVKVTPPGGSEVISNAEQAKAVGSRVCGAHKLAYRLQGSAVLFLKSEGFALVGVLNETSGVIEFARADGCPLEKGRRLGVGGPNAAIIDVGT